MPYSMQQELKSIFLRVIRYANDVGPLIPRQPLRRECLEPILTNRRADLAHQLEQEVHVVQAHQVEPQDLAHVQQVADVGTREVATRVARTAGVQWPFVLRKDLVAHVDAPPAREG